MQSTIAKPKYCLTLAALGVVFGDIGTSPLYAMPASLHGLLITPANVLGALSLIFWSLILVISTRYVTVFLNADNHGEGGVLALLALLKSKSNQLYRYLFWLGVLGAGLLLGDGIITPAISVLSAVEGLKVVAPHSADLILPITIAILLALFLVQRFGTGRLGYSFGPVLLLWFIVIAVVGLLRIWQNPKVIAAINPYYAWQFFHNNGWAGYKLLGGVFLVLTGAEALYADLGHFGKTPIRMAWFFIVLPALVLNYFGEGAHLIRFPNAIINPFFASIPAWFSYPLLIIATLATIIASQAVISASFSLAKQAILLNLCPKLSVVHTSTAEYGQIYVPKINLILAIGTILLVVLFKSSASLTGAYGMSINLVMIVVALLITVYAHQSWHWSITKIICVFSLFLLIDLIFLGANLQKLNEGAWIPLLFALCCAVLMLTWRNGINFVKQSCFLNKANLKEVIDEFNHTDLYYLRGSAAIFITDSQDHSGGNFLYFLKQIKILPAKNIILSVDIASCPRVPLDQSFKLEIISKRIYRLILNYGFTQEVDVPKSLKKIMDRNLLPFKLKLDQVLYFIETVDVNISKKKQAELWFWQKILFKLLLRNSTLDLKFFHLPPTRTISIGISCDI